MPHIPVNLITGFLGVGKTTLVIELLRRKPANERWAVLVNEYGEVGIDGAMIEGEGTGGVTIREVAGGCVCCTTAPFLPFALAMLLQDGRPDRLIVETTGLGHPARIIDLLRGEHYRDRLELRATIGLVAPGDFRCTGMFENPVFMDQVHMADVLVLTKRDQVGDEVLTAFQHWGESLFPPKLLIAAASHGVIDPTWLDIQPTEERLPQYPNVHHSKQSSATTHGWIFPPNDRFHEERLLKLIRRPEFTRAKGVFRVEEDWISINKSSHDVTVKHSAYRRDSRVEFFGDVPNWSTVQTELNDCRIAEEMI